MSYRVLARKYRPQRFEEIVGQEPIVRTLQNAIKNDRLAQAYLFVGPRGVGKTSTARIFAKALNCETGPTVTPCCKCDACLEIAEGVNLDVLEIDGASNNSVESIRTLRENAAFAPAHGAYKIYLIDEVHMLTTAAFNALLKILEEPPAHVKFLFATTEVQKLPATITSRCQRFDLHRLSEDLIAKHLSFIAEQEGVALEPLAAAAIARGADGALRDAESMLDQAISFSGETITEQAIEHIFGFSSRELLLKLLTALLSCDLTAALETVGQQYDAGKDLARLLNDLIKLLHTLILAQSQGQHFAGIAEELLNNISSNQLLELLESLGEAEAKMRWATDKKLQLEMAMMKAIHLLERVTLDDVLISLTQYAEEQEGVTLIPTKRSLPKKVVTSTLPSQNFSSIKTPSLSQELLEIEPPQTVSPQIEPQPPKPEQMEPQEPLDPLKKKELISKEPVSEESTQADQAQDELLATTASQPTPMDSADLFSHLNADPSSTQITELPLQQPSAQEKVDQGNDGAMLWKRVAAQLTEVSSLKFGWLRFGEFLLQQEKRFEVAFHPSFLHRSETLFWPQVRKKVEEKLRHQLGRGIEFLARFDREDLPSEESLLAEEATELAQSVEATEVSNHRIEAETATRQKASFNTNSSSRNEAVNAHEKKTSPNSSEKEVKENATKTPEPLTAQELEAFKKDPLIQEALSIFEAEIVTPNL